MASRVQRRRIAGQPGMPPGAKYVGRPSKWGNPYAVGEVNGWTGMPISDRAEAVSVYAAEMQTLQSFNPSGFDALMDEIRRELRGKDLACWCPLDQPCHADVLLELANA